MTICPSLTPQLEGPDEVTELILGAVGAVSSTGLLSKGVTQEPSLFLTATLYIPGERLLKVFEVCQFKPLILYSTVPEKPVAATEMLPFEEPQSVGLFVLTLVIFPHVSTRVQHPSIENSSTSQTYRPFPKF